MKTNKNTPKIILAITVALLATFISYSTFSTMKNELNEQKKLINVMQQTQNKNRNNIDTYAYAISAKDLKAGEIVSEQDVDFKNFAIEDKTAFENRSDVVNKVLLKDISVGDVFSTSHIATVSSDSMDLREGYRALTLPADNFQGKSEKMKVGALVDVYSSNAETPWFLEGVRILNFETLGQDEKAQKNVNILYANSITFEVPVAYVPDFITNVSKNKLVLVTRGANEKYVRRSTPTTSPKKTVASSNNNYSEASRLKSLPKIPSSIPTIGGLDSLGSEDLPAPVKPAVAGPSVEVIEANVKSKVTFD